MRSCSMWPVRLDRSLSGKFKRMLTSERHRYFLSTALTQRVKWSQAGSLAATVFSPRPSVSKKFSAASKNSSSETISIQPWITRMRERAARVLRQYGSDFQRLARNTEKGEKEKGRLNANK